MTSATAAARSGRGDDRVGQGGGDPPEDCSAPSQGRKALVDDRTDPWASPTRTGRYDLCPVPNTASFTYIEPKPRPIALDERRVRRPA